VASPGSATAPDDDSTITAEAVVWRRLTLEQTPEDSKRPGSRRLSEGGFDDSRDGSGMSVHLVQVGETIDAFLTMVGRPADGVAELSVRDIREAGYGVVRRVDERDLHHCEVTGAIRSKVKRRDLFRLAQKRGLLREPSPRTGPGG
jgi:hypothetical protein